MTTPSDLLEFDATILVVDDDDLIRRMMEKALSRLRYKVFTAADADEAIEIIEAARSGVIDLLITDVGIPGTNGFELAEQARILKPEIKLLFLSGSSEAELKAMAKPEQGWKFLKKPCVPSVIAESVRSLLGRNA